MREIFRAFDTDGDEFLTAADLKKVMSNLGESITDEQAQEMLALADPYGHNRLSCSDFIKMMQVEEPQ